MHPGVSVIAYFADDATRTYQLVQWLPVLELLHEHHPVGVVVRDPESATVLRARTTLPLFMAPSFRDLTDLYAQLDAAVVVYCNNSMHNFQSLLHTRALHAHINHGESDKHSMASNNAKAYDRVFVAGEAAVQRIEAGLLEFDTDRLVRIGRPQLDLQRVSTLPPAPTASRTVLYAPTWEGDAEYNNYSSVDVFGTDIVSAVLQVPSVRLVYKPHPKVVTSTTPAVRAAHQAIVGLVECAARRDPRAGHATVEVGDILAIMRDCDAMITDVSSVGLDWLYLRTDKPLFITDRYGDADLLRQEVPVSRCSDVIGDDDGEVPSTRFAELVAARLQHDEHHLARVAMRHHYFDDLQVGESTARFLEAVDQLVALRNGLLGHVGEAPPHGEDSAIIA